MHGRQVTGMTVALAATVLMALGMPAGAQRGRTYSLVQRTRGADLIAVARVLDVTAAAVRVRFGEAIKGNAPTADVTLTWARQTEAPVAVNAYAAGDEVLVFATMRDSQYDPVGGIQGITKLGADRGNVIAATRAVLAFDAAPTPDNKSAALV